MHQSNGSGDELSIEGHSPSLRVWISTSISFHGKVRHPILKHVSTWTSDGLDFAKFQNVKREIADMLIDGLDLTTSLKKIKEWCV